MTKKRTKSPPVERSRGASRQIQIQQRCTLSHLLTFAGGAGLVFAVVWSMIRQEQAGPLILFGYLPEYRLGAIDLERVAHHVSHLALFSLEVDPSTGAVVPGDRFSESLLNSTRRLTSAAGAQLVLVLGGAGRSSGFPYLLFDAPTSNGQQLQQRQQKIAERRLSRFITELCEVIAVSGADGIDINWQWPGTVAELEFLDRLSVEIRKCGPPHLTLSLPVPPTVDFVSQVGKFANRFDFYHWLGYLDPKMSSVSQAESNLRQILNVLPASKVTLGVPFYGARGRDLLSYEEILLQGEAGVQWESPALLLKKVELARSLNLAGLSVWEIGQDCRPKAVDVHPQTCSIEQSLLAKLSQATMNR